MLRLPSPSESVPMLLAACLLAPSATAQFGPPQLIAGSHDGANAVATADVDGDGDTDVIVASREADGVSWFENTDGDGAFGPEQVVTSLAERAESVHAADLDGDGDTDVLSASYDDDEIAWYENVDGAGTFGPQQVITNAANGALWVSSADVDGDGDQDVLSASFLDDTIGWYENTDGSGAFGPRTTIAGNAADALAVLPVDADVDGETDVLWCSSEIDASGMFTTYDSLIAWSENTDGLGSFAQHTIVNSIGSSLGVTSIHPADLEEDGDQDVASAWYGGGALVSRVGWFRNVDGVGEYSTEKTITTAVENPRTITTADLDGDGDVDIASASYNQDKVGWFENLDGSDLFSGPLLVSSNADGPDSVVVADVDGDGDADLLSASNLDDKVAWYENTDGFGAFGPEKVVSVGATPLHFVNTVFLADLEGDGDLDVVASESGGFFDASSVVWGRSGRNS